MSERSANATGNHARVFFPFHVVQLDQGLFKIADNYVIQEPAAAFDNPKYLGAARDRTVILLIQLGGDPAELCPQFNGQLKEL